MDDINELEINRDKIVTDYQNQLQIAIDNRDRLEIVIRVASANIHGEQLKELVKMLDEGK
jgi:hypothetical protein